MLGECPARWKASPCGRSLALKAVPQEKQVPKRAWEASWRRQSLSKSVSCEGCWGVCRGGLPGQQAVMNQKSEGLRITVNILFPLQFNTQGWRQGIPQSPGPALLSRAQMERPLIARKLKSKRPPQPAAQSLRSDRVTVLSAPIRSRPKLCSDLSQGCLFQ